MRAALDRESSIATRHIPIISVRNQQFKSTPLVGSLVISLHLGIAEKLFGYKTEEVSSPRTLKACGPKQAHDDCRGPSSLHELRVNIQNTFKKAPTLQFQLTTLDCPSF